MAIAPLQLPGPLIVPQLDFSPLDKIGDAYVKNQEIEREATAIGDALRAENEKRAAEIAKRVALTMPTTPPAAVPSTPRSSTPTYPKISYTKPSDLSREAADIKSGTWQPTSDYEEGLKLAQASLNNPPPGGPTMGGQPGATAEEIIPGGGQPSSVQRPGELPLGLKNNNPAYIPDGGVAKALPGYKGAEGGFAAFETPDHGIDATRALLTSYGRRGIKTGGELARQLPGMRPNSAEELARFISPNGDPNAAIDLSDPAQQNQIIGRMGAFANDMHTGMGMAAPVAPPSQAQMAEAAGIMPPELIKRVEGLYRAGPAARALANTIIGKYIGPQAYKFITGADGTIYRLNEAAGTAEPVTETNKPTLTETGTNPLTGEKSYSLWDANKRTLTPFNASGQGNAGAPNPDQLAAKITTLRNAGATQEQLMNEIPAGWRNYVSSVLKSGAIPTNLGRNSQQRSILMNYAHIIDPNFDETQLLERKTFAQGMGDTKNPAAYGGQLQAAGTVVKHLGDAYNQLDEFKKGPLGTTDVLNAINPAKSYIRDQMGDQAFQNAKSHWDIVRKGIAGELERLLSGRGGAESSKQYWLDKLDFNNGPTKISGALDEARSLMMGRVENVALAKDRAYGGPTDPISLFGPKERKIMEQIKGGTFGAQQAAGPTPPANAQPAAGQPQEGERRQFKQGWGVFHNGQWVPAGPRA